MNRLLLLLLIASPLASGSDWTWLRYGSLCVETEAGEKEARQVLNTLAQLRWTLARRLGKQDMEPLWPVRIILLKPSRALTRGREEAVPSHAMSGIAFRRDAYSAGLTSGSLLPTGILRDFTAILLEAATHRLPPEVKEGIAAVFSTFHADGTRITLGKPPAPEARNRNWAAMHLALVDPDYSGKARVYFSVLEQGGGEDAACRNAFGMPAAQWKTRVDQYLAAANFVVASEGGAPLNPERDFRRRESDPVLAQIHRADLLPPDAARSAYRQVLNQGHRRPEALEGLELYEEAVAAGSENAFTWLQWAAQLPDISKAREAYRKAAALNPRWALPYAEQARRETDPGRQAGLLQKATALDPGNSSWWRELAVALLKLNRFEEAGAAYREAERSAPNELERQRLRESLRAFEQERRNREQAERMRREEQQRQELEQLRQQALANIRAAEQKASGDSSGQAPAKVVEWWDDPRPVSQVSGLLEKVDCLGGRLRLLIRPEGARPVSLFIPDPGKVVLAGGGQLSLNCGPQKPPRKVMVDYHPGRDARLGTAGEVTVIDFLP